ncbi:MAG: dephospho-CoA kinase [Deltaproteobacteria bacterium]|nr:dephospho-CoA kinase [Deltaproteobacteria bacterium]
MLIGLTGTVCSGKSLVSKELARLGCRVIDADLLAKEVCAVGTSAYDEIAAAFGSGILMDDKAIDREALGKMVFSDPAKLKTLGHITHPRIRQRIRERIGEIQRADKNAIIVVDAALLIENGLYKEMQKVVVVCADEKTVIKRLVRRNGLNEKEAMLRIRSQLSLEEKKRLADYVVDNNGNMDETRSAVRRLYEELAGIKP